MRYGFSKDGGFVAVDDDARIGEFAFATSERATQAKRNPELTASTMLANTWKECPAAMREEHYRLSCLALDSATRWPVVSSESPAVQNTRFPELGFTSPAPGLWRFVDLSTKCVVGPHYRTKAELLANMDNYADFFGCNA